MTVDPASDRVPLSRDQVERYSRHLILPEVGRAGQERLRAARVLLIGAGGLGSPVALYLAAAGVGTLGIADLDTVDASNLQRQVLYRNRDVGRRKTDAAKERIQDMDPLVRVVTHEGRVDASNVRELVRDYDVVVDGTDNFATRYLVNDACVLEGRPLVYGSIFRFEGQATVFATPDGPCYRCLYPVPPPPGLIPNCAEGGVLGVLPGLVGTIQATEALKCILGFGDTLAGRLLLIDAATMRFDPITVRRDPSCPVCGDAPRITDVRVDPATKDAGRTQQEPVPVMSPQALRDRLERGAPAPLLIDVRSAGEREVCVLPGDKHLPLAELLRDPDLVPRERPVVVYCRSGARSADAVRALRANGRTEVWSLDGGILAWIEAVDPSLARY